MVVIRSSSVATAPVKTLQMTRLFQIRRTDGVTHHLTTHDRPVKYHGVDGGGTFGLVTYQPTPGLIAEPTRSEQGLRDKTTSLTVLMGNGTNAPNFDQVRLGKLDRAQIHEIWIDWRFSEGTERIFNIWHLLGVGNYDEYRWTAELGGWTTFLKRSVGELYERTCINELGIDNQDRTLGPISYCTYDISAHPETVSGTVIDPAGAFTHNQRQFRIQSGAFPNEFGNPAGKHGTDYFAHGRVEFTSGDNNGFKEKVQSSTAALGTTGSRYVDVVMSLPFPKTINYGDTVSIVVGCDKLPTTCQSTKFNNYKDFRGHEFIPGTTSLIRSASANVL